MHTRWKCVSLPAARCSAQKISFVEFSFALQLHDDITPRCILLLLLLVLAVVVVRWITLLMSFALLLLQFQNNPERHTTDSCAPCHDGPGHPCDVACPCCVAVLLRGDFFLPSVPPFCHRPDRLLPHPPPDGTGTRWGDRRIWLVRLAGRSRRLASHASRRMHARSHGDGRFYTIDCTVFPAYTG